MQYQKLRQYKFNLVFLLLFILVFFILGLNYPEENGIKISIVGALFFIFLLIDYFIIKANENIVNQRTLFAEKLIKENKRTIIVTLLLSILIFTFQLNLTNEFHSLEKVMINYGIVYRNVDNGEYSRFLTGMFFHSGFAHWAINTALLMGFTLLASFYSKIYLVIIFLLGCFVSAVSAYAFYLFGLSGSDGFLGISGGVSAIGGVALLSSLKLKRQFPKYFNISLLVFLLAMISIDLLTNTLITSVAHLSGLTVGFFASYFLKKAFTICHNRANIDEL